MLDQILLLYGIQPVQSNVQPFGDGLINHTWKVTTETSIYILQKVNQSVFKNPENIDQNISLLKAFLRKNAPEYLFVTPMPTASGNTLVKVADGYFRLFPFVEHSHSLNALVKKEEAFEAATQFGRFSRLLNDFNVDGLNITLPDFHNLSLRFDQFNAALHNGNPERIEKSAELTGFILEHRHIVETYTKIVDQKQIPLRVIHHDTKINNVLFGPENKGLCVIDLDTVMPGYFISDVGDMMRTYLSAASEEETDLSKVTVRKDFFRAICNGYMTEMGDVLTENEKEYFIYAGQFMIYMQALRFFTDYLLDDIYYGQKYEGHNLDRAKNQLTLLKRYLEMECDLKEIVSVIN